MKNVSKGDRVAWREGDRMERGVVIDVLDDAGDYALVKVDVSLRVEARSRHILIPESKLCPVTSEFAQEGRSTEKVIYRCERESGHRGQHRSHYRTGEEFLWPATRSFIGLRELDVTGPRHVAECDRCGWVSFRRHTAAAAREAATLHRCAEGDEVCGDRRWSRGVAEECKLKRGHSSIHRGRSATGVAWVGWGPGTVKDGSYGDDAVLAPEPWDADE